MPETDELKSIRRLALASLGRNVINFQRLEAALKQLALLHDFTSPMDQIAANHQKKCAIISKKTMGTVVTELHDRLYDQLSAPESSQPGAKPTISLQFRIETDADTGTQQKQRLADLVAERNQLIHQDIAGFDPNNEESCRHWIALLDEQNTRISTQLKEVHELVETCQSFMQKGIAALSDEWRRGNGHQ